MILELEAAIRAFSNKQSAAALRELNLYNKNLIGAEGNGIKVVARRLIAQADAIIGCYPRVPTSTILQRPKLRCRAPRVILPTATTW